MSQSEVKVFAQCDRGSWTLATVHEWSRMGTLGRRFKTIVAAMPKEHLRDAVPNVMQRAAQDCVFVWAHPIAAEQRKRLPKDAGFDSIDICIGPLSAEMTPEQVAEAAVGTKKTTINLDVGPSATKVAEKLDRIAAAAQSIHANLHAPHHEVHRLQTELDDLRAKLRYASVRVPEGFWQVEGLVSSVKGRETPGHQDRAAYLDGVRIHHVTDALPGPHGFIITGRNRAVFNGVVHVFEMDPGRARQPWPESLTFSVAA